VKIGAYIKRAALAAAVFLCHPQTAEACAVCFGKTNDRLQIGMNYGIAVLIVVIGATLTGISGFFYFVAARTKRLKGELKTTNFRNSAET
jgi:hypothetical protein